MCVRVCVCVCVCVLGGAYLKGKIIMGFCYYIAASIRRIKTGWGADSAGLYHLLAAVLLVATTATGLQLAFLHLLGASFVATPNRFWQTSK